MLSTFYLGYDGCVLWPSYVLVLDILMLAAKLYFFRLLHLGDYYYYHFSFNLITMLSEDNIIISNMPSQIEIAARSNGPSTATSRRNKALASAALQKQMQTCIDVQCMSWIYEMEAMKLCQVQQKMFDAFNGNPTSGILPFLQDCLKGENAFMDLWDKVDNTENGNAQLIMHYCFVQ